MHVYDILETLGVPGEKRIRPIEIAKPYEFLFQGTSQDGYHGYNSDFRIYDPFEQLEVKRQDASDQYIYADLVEFFYKGENFAAVSWSHTNISTSSWGILLFAPEDKKQSIIFRAEQKEEIRYTPPKLLKQKWICEVSEKEHRDPSRWEEYARVERKVMNKALVYSAYQFAKDYPDRIGVIQDIWGDYYVESGSAHYYGTSIFVHDGAVEFVESYETTPEVLQAKFGVNEFYPICANIY